MPLSDDATVCGAAYDILVQNGDPQCYDLREAYAR
jgi:hypothetical protein